MSSGACPLLTTLGKSGSQTPAPRPQDKPAGDGSVSRARALGAVGRDQAWQLPSQAQPVLGREGRWAELGPRADPILTLMVKLSLGAQGVSVGFVQEP